MHNMHPILSNSNSIHLMCGWFVVWAFDRITNAMIDKKILKKISYFTHLLQIASTLNGILC